MEGRDQALTFQVSDFASETSFAEVSVQSIGVNNRRRARPTSVFLLTFRMKRP